MQHDNSIELKIADNGKGFDPAQPKKGIGLTNIIHRTEAYGGKISIDTGINKGCTIKAVFKI